VTEALELAERALRAAQADEAEAVVLAERSGFARFAGSEVHQPTLIENESVHLRVVRDGRVGYAAGNVVDDEGLAKLARRAEAAADASPVSPLAGVAAAESVPAVEGDDPEMEALGADDQARLAAAAIEAADGFDVYGFFTSGTSTVAVATSGGQAVEQRLTDAAALTLAAVEGASGYASSAGWRAADVDAEAVSREAVEKARRTRGAVALDPAAYRAVLEPYAIGELLQYFAYETFSGLALLEERSYACGRIGERVFDEKVTIHDDALDPRGLPKAFDFEGVPKQRVALVEEGVMRGAVWDSTSAARAANGQASTGHAPPPSARQWGPLPLAISLAGGEAGSTDELAELIGDGVYVTRLHYLSVVDPREGIITGMTRDGTFRIRDGAIAEPCVNLRFTVSVPELLADVPGLTRERRLVNQTAFYDERYPYGTLVPAVAAGRFDVTGIGGSPGT
jgi:predicted Zn-dependent protease